MIGIYLLQIIYNEKTFIILKTILQWYQTSCIILGREYYYIIIMLEDSGRLWDVFIEVPFFSVINCNRNIC